MKAATHRRGPPGIFGLASTGGDRTRSRTWQPTCIEAIESRVPDRSLHASAGCRNNYGQWKWHERLRPGLTMSQRENGDEI